MGAADMAETAAAAAIIQVIVAGIIEICKLFARRTKSKKSETKTEK